MNQMIKLFNDDNLNVMATMPDESIDVVCIDPPYLYLKNQKLERPFDEQKFFTECKRLLTKDGFIIMFGRGESFYRWNTILSGLGFSFKEEIVWDKSYSTSPTHAVSRVHETISIFNKGNGKINRVKVDYLEQKADNIPSIIQDIKRIKSALNNEPSFNRILDFLKTGSRNDYQDKEISNYKASIQNIKGGRQEVTIINSIKEGMNEKTIIKSLREHYTLIHPTQKPVRLLERLLALVIPKDKPRHLITVADWFAGSASTMEAVYNMGMQGIATEIDKEYFDAGKKRIEGLCAKQKEISFN